MLILLGNLFEQFPDGSFYLSGDWANDDFTIRTTSVDALRVGLAYNTTNSHRLCRKLSWTHILKSVSRNLGLGYQALYYSDAVYANTAARLKKAGFTNVNTNSIWTNQISAVGGELTFAGVDTNKFYGSLETVPFTNDGGASMDPG